MPSRNMLKHVVQCERIPTEDKVKWLAVDAEKKKPKANAPPTPHTAAANEEENRN